MGVRSPKGSGSDGGVGTSKGAKLATGKGPAGRRGAADGSAPSGPGAEGKPSKFTTNSLVELVVIIAIAVLLAIGIQAFVVKPYRIPSGSMEPTLEVGQRVLVDRLATNFEKPHVGEIAVFHPPEGAESEQCGPVAHTTVSFGGAACDQTNPKEASVNFIKRIVAGPGDTIYVKEGHVYRKAAGTTRFVREQDSYIRACGGVQECNFLTPITIPADHWFMMGDNRGESDDSRFWGPVPTSWIIGGAFATYWPPDRIGSL
jgi:signal peptidase I